MSPWLQTSNGSGSISTCNWPHLIDPSQKSQKVMAQAAAMELAPLGNPRFEAGRKSRGVDPTSSSYNPALRPVEAPVGSASPSNDAVDSSDEHERQMADLPPVDGGKDAWLFLTACFAVEALVWGKS